MSRTSAGTIRTVTAIVTVVAAVTSVLLVACGSEDSAVPASTTAAEPSSTTLAPGSTPTTTPPPTTEAPTTTTPPSTAPPVPTLFFPSPQAATDHLVDAWQAGNRDEALRGALLPAVDGLFALPGNDFSLYGCDSGEFDTSTCNYRNRSTNSYAQVTATRQDQGWVVTAAFLSTDG